MSSKTEHQLIQIAESHPDDDTAAEAMRELIERFDKTYFWCIECDGLVTTKERCCMNRKHEDVSFSEIDE